MKKLMLDPADLRVESFAAADHPAGRGTVAAAGAVDAAWIGGDTAKPDCDASGAGSCGYTFCGDDTCDTCDWNTYCGHSCILVCDGAATA
ncbi:MAG TPA: hypothetical protein VF092_21220 [Longimicrobium sp.]